MNWKLALTNSAVQDSVLGIVVRSDDSDYNRQTFSEREASLSKVKSAMEIALERMNQIAVNAEEKQFFKLQERVQKARELFFSLASGKASPATLVEWVTTAESDEHQLRRSAMILVLSHKFTERDLLPQIFAILQKLGLREAPKVQDQVLQVLAKNDEGATARESKAQSEFLHQLQKRGIHGSAIVPKESAKVELTASPAPITAETLTLLATLRRWCLNALAVEDVPIEV